MVLLHFTCAIVVAWWEGILASHIVSLFKCHQLPDFLVYFFLHVVLAVPGTRVISFLFQTFEVLLGFIFFARS